MSTPRNINRIFLFENIQKDKEDYIEQDGPNTCGEVWETFQIYVCCFRIEYRQERIKGGFRSKTGYGS